MSTEKEAEALLEKLRVASMFKDLDLVEDALNRLQTEAQRVAGDLREGKKITRALRRQKTAKRKLHWKTKKKREREYYREYRVPRMRERRAALLEGESWALVEEYWKRKKIPYTITQEEWMDNVDEYVSGLVFYVNRYDTKKPISLDNIIVRQTRTGAVLFDGAECRLKQLGYIL